VAIIPEAIYSHDCIKSIPGRKTAPAPMILTTLFFQIIVPKKKNTAKKENQRIGHQIESPKFIIVRAKDCHATSEHTPMMSASIIPSVSLLVRFIRIYFSLSKRIF
jgi:hypothetical protein